jgi:hypothetical protein
MLLSLGRTGRPTGNTVSGNSRSFFDERRETTAGGVSSETDYMNHGGSETKLLREFPSSRDRAQCPEHDEDPKYRESYHHLPTIPTL